MNSKTNFEFKGMLSTFSFISFPFFFFFFNPCLRMNFIKTHKFQHCIKGKKRKNSKTRFDLSLKLSKICCKVVLDTFPHFRKLSGKNYKVKYSSTHFFNFIKDNRIHHTKYSNQIPLGLGLGFVRWATVQALL